MIPFSKLKINTRHINKCKYKMQRNVYDNKFPPKRLLTCSNSHSISCLSK